MNDGERYCPGAAAGLLSVIMALIVMAGWHFSNQILVQVHPDFAPMQYNTALGFLFSGAALILICLRKHYIARFCATFVIALGFLTMMQYYLDVDYGIDELFMDPVFITKTSHPGRMAPNTAICFFLFGVSIVFAGIHRQIMAACAVSLLFLALISLAGYLSQEELLYGWGTLTRMAIHTATGFLIIGSGVMAYAVWGYSQRHVNFWQILPVSLALALITVTVFSFYTYKENVKARNYDYFAGLISTTQDVLQDRYLLYEEALRGGLGLYYASKSVERHEWEKYVNALEVDVHLPGINGVGYIDYVLAQNMKPYLEHVREDDAPGFTNHPDTFYPDKFIIKFIEPMTRNVEALGLDIGFEANRRAAAERARDLGVPALTKKILLVQDHKKQAGFLMLIPVYKGKVTPETIDEKREMLQGWVYAPFIAPSFFIGISGVSKNQLDFEVFDGKKTTEEALIYNSTDALKEQDMFRGFKKQTVLKIAGRSWTIVWYENDNFDPPGSESLGYILLMFGISFSAFLYFIVRYLLQSKQIVENRVEERTLELVESENRQRAILNNTVDAIITIGEDGLIQGANAAAATVFGYEEEELIGQNVNILMPEPYKTRHDDYLQRYLEGGKAQIIGERRRLEGVHKTKGMFPIELSVSEVKLANGRIFSGIVRDISIEKRAETEIMRANEELERSNHELERFAYIASHDLQEPLRKIGGFTERLEKHMAGQLDEKSEKYMSFILDGVVRMRELVMGLLAYSRVTTSDDNIEQIKTREVVEAAIDNLSKLIEENNANIEFDRLPVVFFDRVMLTQVFQNLIANAIKYRGDEDPDIKITGKQIDGGWEFTVRDNGMGMEEKHLERIFEMFQRLHRKEDIAGTGIGLSLCQKIIERYGGQIRVESEPGQGSTFFFTVLKQEKTHTEKEQDDAVT